MKNPSLLFLAAALLLAATGCEKVVDLDLNTAAAQLVIEANLADDGQPCQVRLSRSVNYDAPNVFPPVTGAVLTLSDAAGGRETLRETSPGQYLGGALRGVPGRAYTLRVETGGAAYVAVSALPPVVPFEGLRTAVSTLGPSSRIEAVVEYTDPAGRGNGYVFRQYRNGRLNKALFIQNDQFNDGKRVSQPLTAMGGPGNGAGAVDDDLLVAGDNLQVEMQNVDPATYEYFRTLNQILQSNPAFSTTPANPKSNFSGGALGYFSAHSRRVRRIVVP